MQQGCARQETYTLRQVKQVQRHRKQRACGTEIHDGSEIDEKGWASNRPRVGLEEREPKFCGDAVPASDGASSLVNSNKRIYIVTCLALF